METPLFDLHGTVGKISKLLAMVLILTTSPASLQAQDDTDQTDVSDNVSQILSPEELNDLLGPIALFPDALVALILPASTVPSDITLAARFLGANGDSASVDGQQWDDSVKGLAKYPVVLKWMDQNLEWTQSLGDAFVAQPPDVMNTIQRLRAQARSSGNLVDTPQQTVEVAQDDIIEIVPANPEIIYVPQYDPEVVYVQQAPSYGPLITFGSGCVAGAWLNYDFNWRERSLYHGRPYGWDNRPHSNGGGNKSVTVVNNVTVNNTTNVYRWQPSASSRRQFDLRHRQNISNVSTVRPNADGSNGNAKVAKPARTSEVRPRNPSQASVPGVPTRQTPHRDVAVNPATPVPQKPRQSQVRSPQPVHVQSPPSPVTLPPTIVPNPAVRPRHDAPQQSQRPPSVETRRPVQPAVQPPHPAAAPVPHHAAASSNGGNGDGNQKNSGDGKKKKDR